ncbi:hypothetical protein SEA_PANAMAXUS_6 [Mycobacterium phage Panamaxus]|uniref:Uncharacterized protein n=1 Tax=Mycobacterium phage Veracruz TaxID=2530154 RepID=A0A481VSQ9_9CAUD|nr:hypothetical protein KIP27_gp05 [Mycobacterium phage Veracruz]AIS73681.1 hypothetical protein PBI_QUINNKIRO_5 [Mycobacterium phage QuinnKiro]ALA11810.1 hypothetical protein SEA_TEXAGE_5 [Mycobacterium phage Texage]AOT24157.1 hypothetical protein SEA_TODACORO_6 [Mycobacterium phage Todacoro]AVP42933.1 hypothetical protein SEA_PANAMAXUS_6 [Mycobacterium phage Panamaxus]AWY03539.1 hypothetical protein SEA_HOOKMOUNT_6 [Mycobacterium phage Hookmount]AYR03387.1 hypothetical protein SEA_POPCICLE_
MTNPTNAEDFDFFFCFETKGMKWNGQGDPDTWYPNIQHGGPGADGEPPALIVDAYLRILPTVEGQEDFVRLSVLYTPTVTWTVVDPDDVSTLPGSIEDYTFAVLIDTWNDTVTPPVVLTGGMVGDGAYGFEYADALPMYEAMAAEPDAPIFNPRFVYTPKITYGTWDMSEYV